MIWLTWRQFRVPGAAVFAALAALAVILALTGPGIAGDYATAISACANQSGGCSDANQLFFQDYESPFLALTALMLVVPPLIGLFWGAPLIARELETGTHRLVWNQSVTRTRWLAVKLALMGLAAMAAGGLSSLAVTWWSGTLDQAAIESFPRLSSMVFDARGVVPIGYSAFAFALGVTVGMLVRRALSAMAITLAVFAVIQFAMPTLVRPNLLPPTQATVELSPSILDGLGRSPGAEAIHIEGKAPEPGAWLLSSQTIDASGNAVREVPMSMTSGPCSPSGAPGEGLENCLAEINRLGYRQQLSYHAPTRFWPFQWLEAGIYLALAFILTGFSFWWLRRRLS